ncbi:hypothetical protein Rrhod_2950 [Rhodococcus rhodnii LMG 5362]|uniref:Uncharacterized protein n=1 Tax=Rhodococcus rhodnii LMG 5362 TaxID=1273125 RepID=R7WK67_9NOCA|nr:hypothetical protein Rrhod_2950 [Rhodococcus rhodnii LMG 5362]
MTSPAPRAASGVRGRARRISTRLSTGVEKLHTRPRVAA